MKPWQILLLSLSPLLAQPDNDVHLLDSTMKPPTLLKKVEPTYSKDGLAAGVQGTILLELVVGIDGQGKDIRIVSPLGFGLDENVIAAVQKWRFRPATKDGKPLAVYATIEVNMRLSGQAFDEKTERRRTQFNSALQALQGKRLKGDQDKALETMVRLSKEKSPGAMYYYGRLLETGDRVPADPQQGRALILEAAKLHYGPALYALGRMQLEGNGMPRDPDLARETIQRAAILGSQEAQFYIGSAYETGAGYSQSDNSAREFFRLCAATGIPQCQFRLGRLLLNRTGRRESDYIQAIAWLELAQSANVPEAAPLLEAERPKLSPQQIANIRRTKEQLVHKTQ